MLRIIGLLIEIANWVRIVLSPLLISVFIGGFVVLGLQNTLVIVIGSLITLTGLIIGVIWATRIWKTTGTTWFMSRLVASPDIDEAIKPKERSERSDKPDERSK